MNRILVLKDVDTRNHEVIEVLLFRTFDDRRVAKEVMDSVRVNDDWDIDMMLDALDNVGIEYEQVDYWEWLV